MKHRLLTILLGVALTLVPTANASIPVFDGSNLAQNILSAARALQSNIHEAKMIANQVQQLQNDLTNLTSLDFTINDELQDSLFNLFDKMGEVHGLMQDLGNLQSRFEELYPDFNNQDSPVPTEVMSTKLDAALNESREMMQGAALTGAQVLENLSRSQEQIDSLVSQSDHAVGNLAVSQATNQLVATVSANLMNLSALMANYTQAHMSYLQMQNTEKAAVSNRMNQVLRGLDDAPTTPAVPMHPF